MRNWLSILIFDKDSGFNAQPKGIKGMGWSNFPKFVRMDQIIETQNNHVLLEKPPIGFTPSALQELHRLYKDLEVSEDAVLRIGVKGGGCSGLSYLLAFDKKEEDDTHYELEGIPVVMKKAHVMYVLGMEVDWETGLNNRGFSFNNPNASETCGCGQSFSA
jgi:iron-sulfur cluster assembly protein